MTNYRKPDFVKVQTVISQDRKEVHREVNESVPPTPAGFPTEGHSTVSLRLNSHISGKEHYTPATFDKIDFSVSVGMEFTVPTNSPVETLDQLKAVMDVALRDTIAETHQNLVLDIRERYFPHLFS